MVSYSGWLGGTRIIGAQRERVRAADAWRRIQEKPTDVCFRDASGNTLHAQTVRIESDNSATPAESAAGVAPRRKVVVYGVRGHEYCADTDIKEGYRFIYAGDEYRCVDIILQVGEIQGIFEATK